MSKKISEAAKRIAAGSDEKLAIGDIGAIKEWTFAGDIVKAVWMLVNQETITEAIIGSGKGYSLEDWLQRCFSLVGKDWRDHVVKTEGFAGAYQQLVSDPSLLFSIGWEPETSFEELARMMMKD